MSPASDTMTRLRNGCLALILAAAPVAMPLAAGLVVAPVHAVARPGLGSSVGSRGSRTYSAPPPTRTNPYGAAPFNQSTTPRSYGGYGSGYGGGGGYGGFRTHPFATGLLGGLVGAGLGGLLFHHGFFGGMHGGAGLLGLLIQLAILFFVVRWLLRRFSGNRPAGAASLGLGLLGRRRAAGASIAITSDDYAQFERALLDVQQAWSMQDMRSLSRFATPEMVSIFNQQLGDLASRNLRNVTSAVRMEQGDLSEAWSEGGRDYASVAMRYSMIDVTTDLTGRVVDGSPNERQGVTELWTFVRARGGSWLLSAIQQTR